jgi:hypothetical protein
VEPSTAPAEPRRALRDKRGRRNPAGDRSAQASSVVPSPRVSKEDDSRHSVNGAGRRVDSSPVDNAGRESEQLTFTTSTEASESPNEEATRTHPANRRTGRSRHAAGRSWKTTADVELYRVKRQYDLAEKRLEFGRAILTSTPMLLRAVVVVLLPSTATAFAFTNRPGGWVSVGAGAISALVLVSNAVTRKVKAAASRYRLRRSTEK